MTANPILPTTALLKPTMPGVYTREMVYDPTWNDPAYTAYQGQRIIPFVWSLVHDTDNTPLWVTGTDPVTFVPSYVAVPLGTDNDSTVSMLDYGNSVLRLYVDKRNLPYPVTPDPKCIFIGKSPRSYTLTRYPGTSRETIISQYFDATGKLVSTLVPLAALDASLTSWYLPRCKTSVSLDDNEEVGITIYNEDGAEVSSAKLFAKQSAVVNESVLYNPTIVAATVTATQRLTNGVFYLYEKQDFASLGLAMTLVYDDGSTAAVPIDGSKCILYGASDFISSFAGLTQSVMIKYYRSGNEAIAATLANPTGEMITVDVPVTVIPNTLGTTLKIVAIPQYNATLARYVVRYWGYFTDGRSHVDLTPYATITSGAQLVTDSSYFGMVQSCVVSVDMHTVDPVNYPTQAIYKQTIVLQLSPPTALVKYTTRDAVTSPYIYGQDSAASRRPLLRYDTTRKQYFIPTAIFGNVSAFLNSFYTQASPPYDPSVALIPQTPTHFVVRDILNGVMKVAAPIPVAQFGSAFNIIGDTTGNYVGSAVMVEFLAMPNSGTTNVLFGVPVDVTRGNYAGT